MKNKWGALGLVSLLVLLTIIAINCGTSNGGGSSAGYSISGRYEMKLPADSLRANTALDVTDIIAVGANNQKVVATINQDGTFTLNLPKGWP